ncbi:hypothetical protein LX81_03242 [Palleronia aestuarii]|uniref:O-antigen ligase-like membrane protein n=1 Tax=Palleronia aestuarii TaxID=568105 RepID=A0A2W7N027_9RHOB|nr:O-antigen ligase family protein [Palleronia aestuarii]PZX13458.1 hypothetical protein LX81_03242 [Palleronia aestuarii]
MTSIALIAWPVVALLLFARLPLREALVWSILLAYLFLPETVSFNFPGIPAFDKWSIPACTLILAVLIYDKTPPGRGAASAAGQASRGQGVTLLFRVLMGCLLLSPVLTVLANSDPVGVGGGRVLSGLRPWDIGNVIAENLALLVPYFMARRYLATPEAHRILLRALLAAGLAYSLLVLVEVRLSPQLNRWVYGFYQHSFAQHVRGGSYRPMVFLQHGLWVGFFLLSVVLASGGLYRHLRAKRDPKALRILLSGLWMMGVLMISRNLGATGLAFLFAPVILFLGGRWQIRLAALVALLFVLYPAVRQSGLVPTERITAITRAISEDRAQSFQFRLNNEDQLLERALERPVTGWGKWGRNRVYNEDGIDVSVTDGIWVIVLGTSGWFGYIAFFGLLALPVILLPGRLKGQPVPFETAALAIVMAANFLYMVPNSTLTPLGWMMAGALAGFVQFERARQEDPETEAAAPPDGRRRLRHTRFGDGARPPLTARRGT